MENKNKEKIKKIKDFKWFKICWKEKKERIEEHIYGKERNIMMGMGYIIATDSIVREEKKDPAQSLWKWGLGQITEILI